jgi:hypothetical protein
MDESLGKVPIGRTIKGVELNIELNIEHDGFTVIKTSQYIIFNDIWRGLPCAN